MGNSWADRQIFKFGMANPAKRVLVQSDGVMGRHNDNTKQTNKSTACTEGQTIVSKGRTLAEGVRETGKEV